MLREHPTWRTPLSNIRDRITFASDAAALRQPSFAILDQLQFYPAEVQMDALFVTAVAMAEAVRLNPHEMVARARRILPDAEQYSDQIRALRDYAKEELPR